MEPKVKKTVSEQPPEKDPMVWDPPTNPKPKKSNWGNKPKPSVNRGGGPVGRDVRNAYKPPGDVQSYNPISKSN